MLWETKKMQPQDGRNLKDRSKQVSHLGRGEITTLVGFKLILIFRFHLIKTIFYVLYCIIVCLCVYVCEYGFQCKKCFECSQRIGKCYINTILFSSFFNQIRKRLWKCFILMAQGRNTALIKTCHYFLGRLPRGARRAPKRVSWF